MKWIRMLLCMILLCITNTSIAAPGPYGKYMNNNPNFPIVNGHMGYAEYLDKSSIVVLKNDNDSLLFTANIVIANADDNYTVARTITMWFYRNNSDIYDIYYSKNARSKLWNKEDLSKEFGATVLSNHTFKLGWETINGYPY